MRKSRMTGDPFINHFENDIEIILVLFQLENTLKEVPTLISTLQAKIALRNEKRDKIVAFMPEAKKLDSLRKTDADLKAKLKKVVEEASALRKEKEDLETTAEVSGRLQQICASSQPDAVKLDSLLNDLKKNEKEMTNLTNKLDKSAGKEISVRK